jgi:hypothetical protein
MRHEVVEDGAARCALFVLTLTATLNAVGCSRSQNMATPPPPHREPASAPTAAMLERTSLVYCAEVSRRVTAEDCAHFRDLAAHVRSGEGAFNAPDPMRRGETVTMQLVVANRMTGAPGPTPVDIVHDLPGTTTPITVKLGDEMAAELSGDAFEIKAMSPRIQPLPRDSVVSWEWQATARSAGKHVLTLKTMVTGETVDGTQVTLSSSVVKRSITVQVGFLGRLQDVLSGLPAWLKGLTAAVAALTGLVAAVWQLWAALRRKREGETGKT